jgi:hypothetical protein
VSLFTELQLESSSYSLGVIAQHGEGKAQKVQASADEVAPLQTAVSDRLVIMLGISYSIKEEKKCECGV